uniref:Protein fem-1 B n=3 Tax=Lygus hesperus TaxID=30085 RepID=A0A146KTZ5_LYGHE
MTQVYPMMALQIFHYARDGLTKVLCSALNDLDPTCIKRLISQEVVNHQGERMTPLIAAVRQGHYKVVKLLVERFGADVNKCGAIRIDSTLVDNASPLWVAAGAGYINIVKDLIEAGAEINHRTQTGSTPIRAACFDGRLEIVQYLAHCGADVEIPNSFHNTCLMIASFRGHLDTVSFLLEIGADPNKKALCGATALHFAAEFGVPRLIYTLLDAGAVITKTNKGFTPVILAAEQAKENVVNMFTQRKDLFTMTTEELIDAYELLGASFANDQKNYDIDLCLFYLRLGMELRYRDPENPIPKPFYMPVPAYGNRIESQSMEDLNDIADDEDAIHMEALIVRERLLGPIMSNEATIPIVYRGVILAEEGRYDRCIALWLHRLELLLASDTCVSKDILRFSQMFSRILAHRHPIEMRDIVTVLQAAYSDLKHKETLLTKCQSPYDQRGIEEERDGLLLSTMELLVIATLINEHNYVFPRLNKTVFDIIKLGVRTSSGQGLLHLATDPSTRVNAILVAFGVKFPYEPLASLLVDCGSDVNDVDGHKNTPLHLVVAPLRPIRDFANIHKIINKLVEKGAHLDAVNHHGKDPLQSTTSLFIQIVLKSHCKVHSLKCLAARAVCKNNIDTEDVTKSLPRGLHEFIQIHGVGKKTEVLPHKVS